MLEKTLESPLDCKEIQPVHLKGNQSWMFIGRTDVEAETPILHLMRRADHLKRPWLWERLKARGEGDDRGWYGWMASLTQWTWVWVNSRSWWWTERPGILQSMESQRVGHNWETELKWTDTSISTLNVHGLNALIRWYTVDERMKRQNLHICCLQGTHYVVYKTLTVLPMGHSLQI